MKKIFLVSVFLFSALFGAISVAQEETDSQELSEEEKQYVEWAQELWASITPQTGEIKLPNGVATLSVSEEFYYLSPADAEKVLVDIWGNPPGQDTLGMLLPAGSTPFDANSWGVTIDYEEDGYVSDEDAGSINYDDLLKQMKSDTREVSRERVKQGYEAIDLIGWAAKPHYDSTTKKLYWAKELTFGSTDEHTLNYNIRALGRKGVLVMNFIAGINQLEEINQRLEPVLAMANFDSGYRYEDFNPDIDKVAAYGIGALVAGKVLAKTGIIATLLILLKKFWIILALAIGGFFKAIFGRNKSQTEP